MLASLWNVVVYEPFYNGLIFLSSLIPAHDVGIAIILLTIIVKVALYPLARKAVASQLEMKAIEGELNALKEKYGTDRAKLAQETMALYKKHGVNPASGCLPIQLWNERRLGHLVLYPHPANRYQVNKV